MKRNLMDWLAGMGERFLPLARPDDVPLEKALDLRQTDEIWECTARRARTWITPPDRDPFRPYIVTTVSRDGKVLGTDILETEPTPLDVVTVLVKAMFYPIPGSGRKRRPTIVQFDDADLTAALIPELGKIDVSCRFRHTLPEAEEALQALWHSFGGEKTIPTLLETPGVTPFMVEGLFNAAASFYEAAPWRWVDDSIPIEIRYPIDSQPRYAVVMGHGGETYGLAIYRSTDVLREIYAGTPSDQLPGRQTHTAILFGEAIETPFDDLDAIEAYQWPVAGEFAYPLPLQLGLPGSITRPGKSDLLQLEAALLAIPHFLRKYMRADKGFPRPSEETLSITMADREDRIHLRYPVPSFGMGLEDDAAAIYTGVGVQERNAELLEAFESWLRTQGLARPTIQKHLDNVTRFAVGYLADAGGAMGIPCPADEASLADVDDFLAEWLPYRTDRALVQTVESHLGSLRKFYTCLKETGWMPPADCDENISLLQEDREYYLELARDVEEGTLAD